jgi:hypothetical protein
MWQQKLSLSRLKELLKLYEKLSHKMRLNFARKLFLMLLKKTPLENLSLRKKKFILHYKYCTQTVYIYQKFHDMSGFVKLRAVSKLSTFLYTLYNFKTSIYQMRKTYFLWHIFNLVPKRYFSKDDLPIIRSVI